MSVEDQYFNNVPARELFDFVCGEKLGSGLSREVYEFVFDPSYVVKWQRGTQGSFQNVNEWTIWNAIKEWEWGAKFLAPCKMISPVGSWLLMKKTEPLPKDFVLPTILPEFLTDFKPENFGLLDGNLVCRDYGLTIHNFTKKKKRCHW